MTAFIKMLQTPATQRGKLDNLSFAVKDTIDIAGAVTGCGNPTWAKTHPPAAANAICIDLLLTNGAHSIGKTITDELAFSLLGENYFYGSPINPKAPDRVSGGSSSGSASAVASGLVDFALGTDAAGSIRVPASNCGIWGYRPTHGRISESGVKPLAPSFDTVGVLAKNGEILAKVISVLLQEDLAETPAKKILFLDDVFSIADAEIQTSMQSVKALMKKHFACENTTLSHIIAESINHEWLFTTASLLHGSEAWCSLGAWVEAIKPELGPLAQKNLQTAQAIDRRQLTLATKRRAIFAKRLNNFLGQDKILCFPTTAILAPKLKTVSQQIEERAKSTYFPRIIGVNAIAGLARAAQLAIPYAEVNGVPIGFSLLAAEGNDAALMQLALQINKILQ